MLGLPPINNFTDFMYMVGTIMMLLFILGMIYLFIDNLFFKESRKRKEKLKKDKELQDKVYTFQPITSIEDIQPDFLTNLSNLISYYNDNRNKIDNYNAIMNKYDHIKIEQKMNSVITNMVSDDEQNRYLEELLTIYNDLLENLPPNKLEIGL